MWFPLVYVSKSRKLDFLLRGFNKNISSELRETISGVSFLEKNCKSFRSEFMWEISMHSNNEPISSYTIKHCIITYISTMYISSTSSQFVNVELQQIFLLTKCPERRHRFVIQRYTFVLIFVFKPKSTSL